MVTHALLPSRRSIPIRITLACYMRAGTAVGGRTRGQPCRLRVVQNEKKHANVKKNKLKQIYSLPLSQLIVA